MKTSFPGRHAQHLRLAAFSLLVCVFGSVMPHARAQDTPLISGGVGFLTNTNRGSTSYTMTIAPVAEVPLGQRVLIESRANVLEAVFPTNPGYNTAHFAGISNLAADVQVNSHVTLVGGLFYTPFNTVSERLSPIWINNFQDFPIIAGIGVVGSGNSLGGQVRGNAFSNDNVSVDYTAYFSAKTSNEQFSARRTSGERVTFFFPKSGVEVGESVNFILEGVHSHNVGAHLWWSPTNSWFRFKSEYAHAAHAQGYWMEGAWRLTAFGGPDTALGRLEPVARWQQVFRNQADPTDGLPGQDQNRADFGLDYHLQHEVRINTSYARVFTAGRNGNIWETGLIYRFLFPAWKGKK
ncbi:MAG TPA: hypothetical protein VGN16_10720 [Acidobacteriaceae bacterium]|jgi:hypothetical protein